MTRPESDATDTASNYVPFRVPPHERAPYLLDEVIEHGDENGALANATADELRDALAIAVERIRELVRRWPGGTVKPKSRPSRLPPPIINYNRTTNHNYFPQGTSLPNKTEQGLITPGHPDWKTRPDA